MPDYEKEPTNLPPSMRLYTPYDPVIIPKLLNIHRCYYNWIQVGESGLTRAERFGIAKGKIRHQDIVHYH